MGAEREHHDGAGFVELAEDGADREEFVAESLGWDVELELGGGMVLRLRRAVHMLTCDGGQRIWLCTRPTDMR